MRTTTGKAASLLLARCCPCLILALTLGCGISRQQEIEIGRSARPQFEEQFGGLYPDADVQRYVQEVGASLVDETDRAGLPWEFRVLNSDDVNAFALPGGFVYITRGMLSQLNNEAQLAAVLAHEVAHVAERHPVQQLQRAQLVQGGAALAGIFGGENRTVGDVAQLVAGLTMMKYSRDQEKDADLSGLKYLAREGYAPKAMVEVMGVLRQLGSGSAPPEFLSSHPYPESREQYLQREIRHEYRDVLTRGELDEAEFRRRVKLTG